MVDAADQPKGRDKKSVQLKQIVTPSHIKIYAATPTTDTFEKLAAKPPISRLRKMGFTAIGLAAAIGAMLYPWPKAETVTASELAEAKDPAPLLPIREVVPLSAAISATVNDLVQPRITDVLDGLRAPIPLEDTVAAPRPAPRAAEAPMSEVALTTSEPAAPLSIIQEEIEPDIVPEAVVLASPVVEAPEPELAIVAPVVEPAYETASAPTENAETDIIKRITIGTVAALREDGDALDLIAFVTKAQKDGITGTALTEAVNAAMDTNDLRVPPRFLSEDGSVDARALLKLMEPAG